MNKPEPTYPSSLFCGTCSKDSFITNGRLDCCGQEMIPCVECNKPTKKTRSAKKFCSPKCRFTYYSGNNPRLQDCCTVTQLAALTGVTPAMIRKKIKAGEIFAHKIGSLYLVAKSCLLHKRPADIKPVKPLELIRPEVAHVFQHFATKRRLSCAGLANLCGCSRTTAHRLMKGTCSQRFFEHIKTSLPDEILTHLA